MHHPKKTIITCAITGSTLSPSMSPYLPVTPDELVEQSIDAAKAGAAIVHLHARMPEDGRPTNDYEIWRQFVPRIRDGSDVIINMSTGGGPTAEKRVDAALRLRPEIATVVVSSMNYGRFKKAEGFTDFKYDWEKEYYGPGSYESITQNSFGKIDRMIDLLNEQGIAMEFECYDVGHLYVLEHHLKHKKIPRPLIIQFLTGILGGIQSDVDHLVHMRVTAERLFGSDVELFTHGTLHNSMRTATCGGLMGLNIRIGQEDNVIERRGELFKSNAEQVRKIKRIFAELNIEVATTQEARKRLGLADWVRRSETPKASASP
jgi:uncharacterized protein (DUF849 family)